MGEIRVECAGRGWGCHRQPLVSGDLAGRLSVVPGEIWAGSRPNSGAINTQHIVQGHSWSQGCGFQALATQGESKRQWNQRANALSHSSIISSRRSAAVRSREPEPARPGIALSVAPELGKRPRAILPPGNGNTARFFSAPHCSVLIRKSQAQQTHFLSSILFLCPSLLNLVVWRLVLELGNHLSYRCPWILPS